MYLIFVFGWGDERGLVLGDLTWPPSYEVLLPLVVLVVRFLQRVMASRTAATNATREEREAENELLLFVIVENEKSVAARRRAAAAAAARERIYLGCEPANPFTSPEPGGAPIGTLHPLLGLDSFIKE